jgi:UTP--glucose-1-phosphate uridylyltransferase
MNQKKVRKAVIAAAGFGTRFLPQTKAMPKEMLPLVDKPIIQYIVEELVDAGIEDIVIVTGYHKRSIEDHFDTISADLRDNLIQGKKDQILEDVQKVSNLANFAYIRQKGPYGNATPLLNAAHLIGDEPFIYTFADDFVVARPKSRFKQMIELYEQTGANILTCIKVEKDEDFKRYGIVAGTEKQNGIIKVSTIIEKPGKENAPSNLASVSGYIFNPNLFEYLIAAKEHLVPGEEFVQQPSIQQMINDGHQVLGLEVENGRYYDTGNKLEYLKTVVDFALEHEDLKDKFLEHLASVVASNKE